MQHVFCVVPVLWQLSGADAGHADAAPTAEPTREPKRIRKGTVEAMKDCVDQSLTFLAGSSTYELTGASKRPDPVDRRDDSVFSI